MTILLFFEYTIDKKNDVRYNVRKGDDILC